MEMFEVGGCVRDELLGVPSKDIDFSVVLEKTDFPLPSTTAVKVEPYDLMVAKLESMGVKMFRNKNTGAVIGAEHFTARGQAPKSFPNHPGRDLDFVLARKEGVYSDGRRPDSVEVGTLMDDLRRRDFTMNAIAKAADGSLVDPFKGVEDIDNRVINAVGSAFDRLTEDALRAVRALRFSVTKGFRIDNEVEWAMQTAAVLERVSNPKVVAAERIDEELSKMFAFDTLASLRALERYKDLTEAMFSGRVRLDSTLKEGRGGSG